MDKISTPLGVISSEIEGHGTPYIWSLGLTDSVDADKTSGRYDWSSLPARCQMVRYDALGHGHSQGTVDSVDYHWSRLADDIFRVADHYQLDQFITGGASMGCASSIYAALKQPERIKGLVLVIPPTAWETRQPQVQMYEKLALMVEDEGIDKYLKLQQKTPLSPPFLVDLSPDYKALRRQQLKQMDAACLPAIYRGAGASDLPDIALLKSIQCPVLVLGWHGDTGHPASTSECLFDLLPQAVGSIASLAEEVRQWPQRIGDFIESIG